jgi:hypothetical protein
MASRTEYGEAWVYESIVGALPGVEIPEWLAVAIQLAVFETAVVVLALVYDLPEAALVGSAVVIVAAAGSVVMLGLGSRIRELPAPDPYRRLLFGSSVEVVLGVLAFVALVTHLFVYDPRTSANPLFEALLGAEPPLLVVYLTLLLLWDVAYRIGTSWWACVVAVWRSLRYDFDPETARAFQRVDALNLGFGIVQLILVPFLLDRPVLLAVVLGHVVAVIATSSTSILLLHAGSTREHGQLTRT